MKKIIAFLMYAIYGLLIATLFTPDLPDMIMDILPEHLAYCYLIFALLSVLFVYPLLTILAAVVLNLLHLVTSSKLITLLCIIADLILIVSTVVLIFAVSAESADEWINTLTTVLTIAAPAIIAFFMHASALNKSN